MTVDCPLIFSSLWATSRRVGCTPSSSRRINNTSHKPPNTQQHFRLFNPFIFAFRVFPARISRRALKYVTVKCSVPSCRILSVNPRLGRKIKVGTRLFSSYCIRKSRLNLRRKNKRHFKSNSRRDLPIANKEVDR